MASYRERHERFVSDLTGGPLWEVYSISGLCLLGYAAWLFLTRTSGSRTAVADFAFNWAVPLAAITVYANQPFWLLGMLLVPIVTAVAIDMANTPNTVKRPERVASQRPTLDQRQAGAGAPRKAFITVYRGGMLVMTATAILAVDFPIFPRRLAKVETWGTSLMDLGVGSFVFSMGLVSARHRNPPFGHSLWHSLKVLTLGIVRLAAVKLLGYQEHVTEYGVHWNFFMTLGLLPLVFTLLNRFYSRFPGGMISKGALVALAYELVLKNTGLQEWVLTAKRDTLVAANKEGMASFWGYLAIFMIGNSVGSRVLDPATSLGTVIKRLTVYSIVSHVIFAILRIATEPSRRLANLPYVAWILGYNTAVLACFATGELLWRRRGVDLSTIVSPSLASMNQYGQTMFLVANLLTGIVNMAIKTIDLTQLPALAVLIAYQGVLFWFVALLP